IILSLPARETLRPDDVLFGEFTVLFAGGTASIKDMFARHSEYLLPNGEPDERAIPNGFLVADRISGDPALARHNTLQFRPTTVVAPAEPLRLPTDEWPFLYLRKPIIPALTLRGIAIMGSIA